MSVRPLHIMIAGMIAADPYQGGATWAVLQYILGFQALGHEVTFVEPIQDKSIRPGGAPLQDSQNASYFRQVIANFGLSGSAGLLDEKSQTTVGITYEQMSQAAGDADLLINISGLLTDRSLLDQISRRVYLDLDPAFNQLWHTQGVDVRFAGHTDFVTIGRAIGQADCPIPTCGFDWITTWQPIVLDLWPAGAEIGIDAFTTVGNWRAYGSIDHDGVQYGQKAHSLRRYIELPALDEKFLLAMAIHSDEKRDLEALRSNGWQIVDPMQVAGTPGAYQQFVQGSLAELGIAKSGYVNSQCGWFSDRSICYLASGRPVIAQDTGLQRLLPTGRGLLTFSNMDELVHAIADVRAHYRMHTRAARELAEDFFDSKKVLNDLLYRLEVAQ